ncbi:NAD-dependent epimerase [Sphaerisporangium krabiense]|uniref:Nucleoside-diphosphate-sugar epimerase n=1 Tax=Sphaerisporangium krabiense TaxID=763782 RepID=A0A7W9DRT9_9ACTN|nr:NAD-dependent epimerase/dehydratase family protein [Sphaerisporangium krabiense]MBB5628823.1 nucleoside-diphosphate-sugar epimerase [Sphaerisporangium krabiense]GII60335.1 NAD-dependent epimerase [Sphaerisporangium krabiense]
MGKHVVVGAGQVGARLVELLAGEGHEVVIVTRSGAGPELPGVTRVAADAGDAGRLTEVARKADALYNCANPRYHRWPQDWPPIAAALLQAAETSGAVLVTLSNLYGYGPVDRPMTEDMPLASTGAKGRVRARMWADALAAHRAGRLRATEVRGSDYFGPETTGQSFFGDRFLGPVLAGRTVRIPADPGQPHSMTYLPDVARALATAGSDERAWGRAWHVPTSPALTIQEVADRAAAIAGVAAPRVKPIPHWVMRAGGLFSPLLRELEETRHQFVRPFVVDSTAFETTFGVRPTPLDEALVRTITWMRATRAA